MKVILYAQLENILTHTPVLAPACYAMYDQIYAECKRFGKVYNISTVCAYGGGSMWEQQKACQEGAEIIVATPVGILVTPVGILVTPVGILVTPVGIVATPVGTVATLVGTAVGQWLERSPHRREVVGSILDCIIPKTL